LVGHEHETGAENDNVKLFVFVIFLKIVKVHMFNGDILIFLEELLAGGNVIVINVDTENFCIFKAVQDTLEGMPSGGANIKYFLDGFGGFLSPIANGLVGSLGEELRVDVAVNEGGDVAEDLGESSHEEFEVFVNHYDW
jgi:hypothetical protein